MLLNNINAENNRQRSFSQMKTGGVKMTPLLNKREKLCPICRIPLEEYIVEYGYFTDGIIPYSCGKCGLIQLYELR